MAKHKNKRGPKPNHLQLDDEKWEDALKREIQKKNQGRLAEKEQG